MIVSRAGITLKHSIIELQGTIGKIPELLELTHWSQTDRNPDFQIVQISLTGRWSDCLHFH